MIARKSAKRASIISSECDMDYGMEKNLMSRMALPKINVQQTQVFKIFYSEKSISLFLITKPIWSKIKVLSYFSKKSFVFHFFFSVVSFFKLFSYERVRELK